MKVHLLCCHKKSSSSNKETFMTFFFSFTFYYNRSLRYHQQRNEIGEEFALRCSLFQLSYQLSFFRYFYCHQVSEKLNLFSLTFVYTDECAFHFIRMGMENNSIKNIDLILRNLRTFPYSHFIIHNNILY
jgi:hypothetical protein